MTPSRKDRISPTSLTVDTVAAQIRVLRGHRVLIDADLAALYEVPTKVLVQAVKRNAERFPPDFMFQLSEEEFDRLRSQSVTSNGSGSGRGGRRSHPYAFTEQGVAMLSSVLHSPRAITVNIEIMRAFVQLRAVFGSHKELARKLATLESKYDAQFKVVFEAIRQLMTQPPLPKRRGIGFVLDEP